MAADSIVISGRSHGRRATLEVTGDRLTWRAHRGGVADNVATTVHDTGAIAVTTRRWSIGALVVAALGAMWRASEGGIAGFFAIAIGLLYVAYRLARPTHILSLTLGGRILTMELDSAALDAAVSLRLRHGTAHAELLLDDGIVRRPPTLP